MGLDSTILFLTLITCFVRYSYLQNSIQIKDFQISKCSDTNYPIIVSNVSVHLESKGRVQFSGAMSTAVDLIGPIKGSVYLKRKVWGVWIPVPCEKNKGSCTYNNLCNYGYPKNESCPPVFIKNNVPCRCPIKKGNYTILPTLDLSKQKSILSGKYKGITEISQNGTLLSCYNFYFTLYDENYFISLHNI